MELPQTCTKCCGRGRVKLPTHFRENGLSYYRARPEYVLCNKCGGKGYRWVGVIEESEGA